MTDFFDTLVRYEVALWSAVDQALRRHGPVRAAQLQGLSVIQRHEGTGRVQDVSTEIGITVSAASKLVDRLERDGLVQRQANPHDRRSSFVALTKDGAAAHRAAAAVRAEVLNDVLVPEAAAAALSALAILSTRLEQTRIQVQA